MKQDSETLVILAINVEPVNLALFKEVLEENGIQYFVTGGNNAYGSRGLTYVGKGIATYTIRVRKSDEERAIKLMTELGFPIFSEDDEEQNFLKTLVAPLDKIPFLRTFSMYAKLSIMAVIFTGLIMLVVFCFRGV